MHEYLSIILPPLVGGVIGYVTNDIAIKMLFRPYTPIYIFGYRLPFTPGIVPKRQKDLAVLLGREVEDKFFNADDLEIVFQSDVFSDAVADSVTDLMYSKKTSLCLAIESAQRDETVGTLINSAKSELCTHIKNALLGFDFAPMVERAASEVMSSKRADLPRGTVKNTLTAFAPSFSDGIKEYLRENGDKVIGSLVDEMITDFADRPVKEIAETLIPDRELIHGIIKSIYLRFMSVYVRRVVESIDVGGMITEKLRGMDPKAIETLVLAVVKREFRYVVLLGGLIGAVIGTVNIFI